MPYCHVRHLGILTLYTNLSCKPNIEIDPNPDVGGNGVFGSILATAFFTIFLTLSAAFLHPMNISTLEKICPPIEKWRQFHRVWWYPTIQEILPLISDQLFISGLALLISAIIEFAKMSRYHIMIVSHLQALCIMCYLSTLTYEDLPLEDVDQKNNRGRIRGFLRVPYARKGKRQQMQLRLFFVIIYSAALTRFMIYNAKKLCGKWDGRRGDKCFWASFVISSNVDCKTQISIVIVVIWIDVLVQSYKLSDVIAGITNRLVSIATSGGILGVMKLKLKRHIQTLRELMIYKFSIYILYSPTMRTVWYLTVITFLMVEVMDLKLSNTSRFRVDGEVQENEWSFGQIVAVVMLATIPVTVLKVIWGMDDNPRQVDKNYFQLRNFSPMTDILPRYHDSPDPDSNIFNYQDLLESPMSPASTDPRCEIPRAQTPDSITFRAPLRRTGSVPEFTTCSSSRDFSNTASKSRSFLPAKSSPMVSLTPLTSADWDLPLESQISSSRRLDPLNTQFGSSKPLMTFDTQHVNSEATSSDTELDDSVKPTTNMPPEDSELTLDTQLARDLEWAGVLCRLEANLNERTHGPPFAVPEDPAFDRTWLALDGLALTVPDAESSMPAEP